MNPAPFVLAAVVPLTIRFACAKVKPLGVR